MIVGVMTQPLRVKYAVAHLSDRPVSARLITVQAVETARCLDERVVTDPRDADVGALLGWGFPAFRGGPVSHIHRVGVSAFVELCDRLAAQHGRRFAPPALLRDMADKHAAFYER